MRQGVPFRFGSAVRLGNFQVLGLVREPLSEPDNSGAVHFSVHRRANARSSRPLSHDYPPDKFGQSAQQPMTPAPFSIRQLTAVDVASMHALMTMFGSAFSEVETYTAARPRRAYFESLLGSDHFIAIAAFKNDTVVGGLAAYELKKFERERSEIYIYDLAVDAAHRREGIATALILELKKIAAARSAHVIFVQADTIDAPAIALYSKLGAREDVLHFDIAVDDHDAAS